MLLLLQKSICGSGSRTGAILLHQQRHRSVARSQGVLPEKACRSTRPRSARMMSHPRRYLRVIHSMLRRRKINKRKSILNNSLDRTDPYTHSSVLDSSFAVAASVAQPACVLFDLFVCVCVGACFLTSQILRVPLRETRHGRKTR